MGLFGVTLLTSGLYLELTPHGPHQLRPRIELAIHLFGLAKFSILSARTSEAVALSAGRLMSWITGANGFKSRWCVVLQNVETGELRARICPSFAGLLTLAEGPSIVTVDIPIGLPEVTRPGGRLCEQQARKILGSVRLR